MIELEVLSTHQKDMWSKKYMSSQGKIVKIYDTDEVRTIDRV